MASDKRVVSVSLGTSTRDMDADAEFLGVRFHIERRGTDGDHGSFERVVAELDGKIDCFGIGGTDAYLYAGARRYAFRQTLHLMRGAKATPWVDGSGIKHTLERETVGYLQEKGIVDFRSKRVLVMAAVDRFGLGEATSGLAKSVVFGDLLFGLGIPIPIRSWAAVKRLARIALPIITRLPVEWIIPRERSRKSTRPSTGGTSMRPTSSAGDWHFIRRYMPERLDGKIILTQSSRKAETELLRSRGAAMLVTTTPEIGGGAFATNVIEAVVVALLGKRPEELTPADYLGTLKQLGWAPSVQELTP